MEISATSRFDAPAAPASRPADRDDAPGFGFRDLLGALNPLQNLPLVGSVYRQVTGDKIHPAAQVVGGLIFGGPIGMFVSVISAAFEQATGKAPLAMAIDAISPGRPADNGPMLADAATASLGPTPDTEPAPEPAPQLVALQQARTAAATRMAAPTPPRNAPARPAIAPEPAQMEAAPRPRIAGARNLAFYQAHAGARLPAAGGAAPALAAGAQPAAPRLQARAVAEVAERGPAPVAPSSPTGPTASPAAAMAQGGQDFATRMLQGLERYRMMTMAGDARAPALSLTR
jgi:hypothetical protein